MISARTVSVLPSVRPKVSQQSWPLALWVFHCPLPKRLSAAWLSKSFAPHLALAHLVISARMVSELLRPPVSPQSWLLAAWLHLHPLKERPSAV
jgi:hypothetical protein